MTEEDRKEGRKITRTDSPTGCEICSQTAESQLTLFLILIIIFIPLLLWKL